MKKIENMKRIAFIIILGLSLSLHAQRGKGDQHQRSEFTPEQQAVLKTKKMALHLDLSEDQQERLTQVNKSWAVTKAEKRKEFKAQFEGDERPDADARYEHQLQMLNDKMAYQKEVEKILNKDQYDTWKEHQNTRNRGQAGRKGHGKRNSNKRES